MSAALKVFFCNLYVIN